MSTGKHSRLIVDEVSGRTRLPDEAEVRGYVLHYLALGGMSVAYTGTKDGEIHVLKEVPAGDTDAVPALFTEKSLLERLSHPSIVEYKNLFCEDGYYYLVVEYIPGHPLTHFLQKKNRASLDSIVDWGVQLANVFDYLHHSSPPIIYRDLKPENVLICNSKVKLIDFGIARIHKGNREKDTTLFGSIQTASPEHYGRGETGPSSDVYTLAATLHLLLSSSDSPSTSALMLKPLKTLECGVPDALSDVIEKALQMEPSDRYQSASEFRDALLEAVGQTQSDDYRDPRVTEQLSPEVLSQVLEQAQTQAAQTSKTPSLLVVGVTFGAILALGSLVYVAKDKLLSPPKRPTASATQAEPTPSDSPAKFGPYQGTAAGLEQANIQGDIFSAGAVDGLNVVMLGEDVGLFQVTGWQRETSEQRAATLAERLNELYHQHCPLCGGAKLDAGDIRVGRHIDSGNVAVFFCHMHPDGKIFAAPLLLATVTQAQADVFQVTPSFLASSWRNLLRDTVQLSRGYSVANSSLGKDLENALRRARKELKSEEGNVKNLRTILREVTGKEALDLSRTFLKVPKEPPSLDSFDKIDGYQALKP